MAWPKGVPRDPATRGGRKKGTPNKDTRPWKEFVTALVTNPNAQKKLEAACLERPDLLFKAAEHAVGKPKETVEIRGDFRMIQWPDGEDIAETD